MKGRRHRPVWRVVPRSSKQACAAPARQRLVWAVAGSLMLHGVGLAVLILKYAGMIDENWNIR